MLRDERVHTIGHFRLFRPDHVGDRLRAHHLLERLTNGLLYKAVRDLIDVRAEHGVQLGRVRLIELKRERHVECERLSLHAVHVDLVILRGAFTRAPRENERLEKDRILFNAREKWHARMHTRAEWHGIHAATGAMNHNADVARRHVGERRGEEQRNHEERGHADHHAFELLTRFRVGLEMHRAVAV